MVPNARPTLQSAIVGGVFASLNRHRSGLPLLRKLARLAGMVLAQLKCPHFLMDEPLLP